MGRLRPHPDLDAAVRRVLVGGERCRRHRWVGAGPARRTQPDEDAGGQGRRDPGDPPGHAVRLTLTNRLGYPQPPYYRSKTSSVLLAVATSAPEPSVTVASVKPTREPAFTTVPVAVSRPLVARTALR